MALGLDLGSRTVKGVRLRDGRITDRFTADTVPFLQQAVKGGRLDLTALGLPSPGRDEPLVLTGYGRQRIKGVRSITEIRAHFQGAVHQTGLKDFALVEIGGQDTKVIQVRDGRVFDFRTNDKCAAGTGRYVENMAHLLSVSLEELSAAVDSPTRINNTCAIFGESEIIGQVVEGAPIERIMAGVNDSIARRVAQMIKRYHPPRIVFCGGVALNRGVVERLKLAAGVPVIVPPEPQFNGAIGCALEGEESG